MASRPLIVSLAIALCGCPAGGLLETPTPASAPTPSPDPPPGQLRIAEVVTSNRDGLLDEDGDTSDWIELSNVTSFELELEGYGLSQSTETDPWMLPPLSLSPGERLVVFASGKDRRGDELHADFQLASAGEPLLIVDPEGVAYGFDPIPSLASDDAYGAVGLILLDEAAPYRYRTPEDDDWTDVGFDDSGWSSGAGSLGVGGSGGDVLTERLAALESWWTFDGAAGGSVPDLGGVHAGSLESGAQITSDGRDGDGLAGSPGGWMAAADPEGYDFAADFTWSLWMRGTDASGCLISRNPAGTDWNQGSKALFVRGGTLQFDTGWVGNPGTGVDVTGDQWHHVAATYDAGDDTLRLYVDGVAAYDQTFENGRFPETTDHNGGQARTGLFVGQANVSGGLSDLGKYDGTIDDVAIWTEALSGDEIRRLMDGAAPGAGGPGGATDTSLPDGTRRAQARWSFTVDDPAAVAALELHARYDDGIRVFLNGDAVASRNVSPGSEVAVDDRDDALAAISEAIHLPLDGLRAGENVLAVEVLAAAEGEASLLIAIELLVETHALHTLARPTPGTINAGARSGPVTFSVGSGVYSAPLQIEVDAPAGATVRYTTNGQLPDEDSATWLGPLTVDETLHLRARAWEPDKEEGPVARADYVFLDAAWTDRSWDLPVVLVSMVGSPADSYRDATLFAWETTGGAVSLSSSPSTSASIAIRRRGASSRSQPKTPYRVEIRDDAGDDFDVPLLGLPSESDWVLHAPYIDKSLMRNALAFELGRTIGLEAPRSQYAHLLMLSDGDDSAPAMYRGVYVLLETVKASGQRLDIDVLSVESPDPDGGWMLKFEGTVAQSPLVPGWEELEFNEPSDPNAAQEAAIVNWVDAFDAFLFGGSFTDPAEAAQWVDQASWVDLWVMNELFRDQDAYRRSSFLHRPAGGALKMGPLWDFNLVAGTGGYFENTSTSGWQWEQGYNQAEHGWYVRVMEDPAFVEATETRWAELRAGALSDEEMAARITEHAQRLAAAAEENFDRWPNLGDDRVHGFVSPSTQTWEEQVEHLRTWLAERSAWIDGQTRR